MRRWMILVLFVPLLLAATLPLRMALDWAGADRFLSASRVEGTVWNGRLMDAQARGLPLGDVSLALDIPSLFTGRLALRYAADGAGGPRRGVLHRDAGAWRMERRDNSSRAL